MLVKVCGIREEENAMQVASLGIDLMGFIFYEKSPRFVANLAPNTPSHIKRVGVFVNATEEFIIKNIKQNRLDFVQLHGSESPEFCRRIGEHGVLVIKAISLATESDLDICNSYLGNVTYILFDTKCESYGGSGHRFDWSILNNYSLPIPFFLSGGIDETMRDEIEAINHPEFKGVDLNSRFEIAPAKKDINKLKKFLR